MKYLTWDKLFKIINWLSIRLLTTPLNETVCSEGDHKASPPPIRVFGETDSELSPPNEDPARSFGPSFSARDAGERPLPEAGSASALD